MTHMRGSNQMDQNLTMLMKECSKTLHAVAANKGRKTTAKALIKLLQKTQVGDASPAVREALAGAHDRLSLWVDGEINNAAASFCADRLDLLMTEDKVKAIAVTVEKDGESLIHLVRKGVWAKELGESRQCVVIGVHSRLDQDRLYSVTLNREDFLALADSIRAQGGR